MKKLNKKGFTLVELLAVIAILGILMLLVMPNVLSMFTSGRKNTFVNQVQSVWRTAETQYMNDSMAGTIKNAAHVYSSSCSNDSKTAKTCTELDISSTGLKYCVVIDSDGKVTNAIVADDNYNMTATTFSAITSTTATDGTKDVTEASGVCSAS